MHLVSNISRIQVDKFFSNKFIISLLLSKDCHLIGLEKGNLATAESNQQFECVFAFLGPRISLMIRFTAILFAEADVLFLKSFATNSSFF